MIKTIGASNHTDEDRELNDYYATNPFDLCVFLDQLDRDGIKLNNRIWESACGEGHISQAMIDRGHDVLSTDVIDRGFDGFQRYDFISELFKHTLSGALDSHSKFDGDIVTNPPFKFASEFIKTGLDRLESGALMCYLLPLRYLETKERYYLFKAHPPKYVYTYSYRINIGKKGIFDGGNAMAYCWIVWEKDSNTEPIIRLIPHPSWSDRE